MVHVKNEGIRTMIQAKPGIRRAVWMLEQLTSCCSRVATELVIKMKRRDHTETKWQYGQVEFLEACEINGAVVCVALG